MISAPLQFAKQRVGDFEHEAMLRFLEQGLDTQSSEITVRMNTAR